MSAISLPWPHKALHPNARVHWAEKARATKLARQSAAWAARADIRKPAADRLKVTVNFHPPDNRKRDLDGMFAACKAYFDGISDVIGIDDSNWSFELKRGEPRKYGAVVIELGAAE